jgi:diacylglycerol kinase
MSNTQVFFAIAGVVTLELLLVVVFLFRLCNSIERLIDNFTNHFHTADELHGFTDPPIIPKGEAE